MIVFETPSLTLERLELGPYHTNAYVLAATATGDAILVDAPDMAGVILERLKGLKPACIVMTHRHFDHTGALAEVSKRLKVPVAAHPLDAPGLPCPAGRLLNDGDALALGGLSVKVLHTPGHTPGGVCLSVDRVLISGDTLFPGGPGATRSPADLERLLESIEKKLFVLPDDTAVYPGHGESTTIGKEKKAFAAFKIKPRPPGLYGDISWK